jgi:N-acyl-D-amino-acid deacylase
MRVWMPWVGALLGGVGVLGAMPPEEAARTAVERALPLLERSAAQSLERRNRCFTCHHQGLPAMALMMARQRGFRVDGRLLENLVGFTAASLERNREGYLAGKGQGGQALTAGYALWTLETTGRERDALTGAVASYLLGRDEERAHWDVEVIRPPAEESRFAVSYVALRGARAYAGAELAERAEARTARVLAWARATPPGTTEDVVFRGRLLALAGGTAEEVAAARDAIRAAQRTDGGWGQLPERPSDAYATATALAAWRDTGGARDETWARGIGWLAEHQEEDGSWHVASRCKPVQAYYESGYPHGKDQFLSILAAGWAVLVLAEAAQAGG